MRLVRQILREQRVHRSLEPDVRVRDVPFGERDDVDASEREALERPAVSSWSRLKRSSDSASTTLNRRFNASRINAWNPERSSVAPEIA
jgi:hypothetical protein